MRPALALALFASLLVAGCRRAKPAEGTESGTLEVGGLARTYLLHVPAGESGEKLPLVVALHGAKGEGASQEKLTGLSALADETRAFVVVYPDGIDASWNDGRPGSPAAEQGVDDVAFVDALLDHLATTVGIDPTRVYVTGMSNGSMMTQRLACELGDRIAAIGPVAGLLPDVLEGACVDAPPMPTMMFFGTDDPLMPYEGGELALGAGGVVLSAEATLAFWADQAGCAGEANVTPLPAGEEEDGVQVLEHRFQDCSGDAIVVMHELRDGGHTWPGGWQYLPEVAIGKTAEDVDASRLLWAFFDGRRRP